MRLFTTREKSATVFPPVLVRMLFQRCIAYAAIQPFGWMSCCVRKPVADLPHPAQFGQVCCRVLSAGCSSTLDKDEDGENPRWRLVGVLLPPFLHGLCMCVDRPRIAEGMLPPLVSVFFFSCFSCVAVVHRQSSGSPSAVHGLDCSCCRFFYVFYRCTRCAFRRYSHVVSPTTPARRQQRQAQKKFCVRPS